MQNDVRYASPVPPSGREDCPILWESVLPLPPTTWRDTAKCERHADVRKLPSGQDDISASKMSPVMKRKTTEEATLTAGPALLGSAEATTGERPRGIQLRPDILCCAKRSAQNSDATFSRRTIRTAKPDLCVRIDGSSFVEEGYVPAGDMATPVPDLGLAGIDPNAAVLPQLLTQNPVDRHNPVWLCNGVHIIVESQESLVWTEARLH